MTNDGKINLYRKIFGRWILGNFAATQKSMRQRKKKQKRNIIFSSRESLNKGLHPAMFCNNSLDHAVFLKRWVTVSFPLLWSLCIKTYLIWFLSGQIMEASVYTKVTRNVEIKTFTGLIILIEFVI